MKVMQRRALAAPHLVAGVDEVGRGPLAGPVVAAAVILDASIPITGLADSKALSESRRTHIANDIRDKSLAWSIAWADAAEIDAINILQATFLAMRRALLGLRVIPGLAEIDGNRLPNLDFDGQSIKGAAIVRGDASVPAISAASIIAKVYRDQRMRDMHRDYPQYGFDQHKGYGTAVHRDCIERLGPCPEHRRTFRPVSIKIR
ncbi:MAG: ribonuclease HII [Woeseia sp.]|jgi:ribonuclease HII|nr:ribonuclease HII [Woeseia sp.]